MGAEGTEVETADMAPAAATAATPAATDDAAMTRGRGKNANLPSRAANPTPRLRARQPPPPRIR